jgi:CHAT domain-containing protein
MLERSHRDAHVVLLIGADATYASVMHELRSSRFDVVHFAGHAWVENGAAYMALNDHAVYASELAMLLNRHPPALLFVNSHHTGFVPAFARVAPLDMPRYASIHDLHRRLDRRRFGFEYVAARAGVGSFIGCMGEPQDEGARVIAEKTYQHLLEGAPLARALSDARLAVEDTADVTPYCTLAAGYADLRLVGRGKRVKLK